MAATEITVVPLKTHEGLNFDAKPGDDDRKILDGVLKALSGQPGFQRAALGLKVEDQNTMAMIMGMPYTSFFSICETC